MFSLPVLLCTLALVGTVLTQATYDKPQHAFEDPLRASQKTVVTNEDIWLTITPTTNLVWYQCYTGRECARLLVPLDYSQKNGTQASIALVRVPSTYPADSSDYRGPILFNPGGPGGSGVDSIATSLGDMLSQITANSHKPDNVKGIARSRPRAAIFATAAERAQAVSNQKLLDDSDEAIARVWAAAKNYGELVEERAADYFELINTDNTARDMLQIVKAHGRTKLQYYGISYGSLLGATFAAMFPDRVGRLVIDGIIDAEEWFSKTNRWQHSLRDTGKVMQSFYDGCYAAGPEGCPFYAPDPKYIAQNLTAIANSLRKNPIPVKTDISYGLMDWARLHSTIFSVLYQPFTTFYLLAQALADLANGNATTFYSLADAPLFDCNCATDPGADFSTSYDESGWFVICSDGDPMPPGLDFALSYYHDMDTRAEWGGGIMASLALVCTGWPKFRRTNFQGPFTATTSFPLLIIGNIEDPVTPLWSAQRMSAGFKNSVLLKQNSSGHTSISWPSPCTIQIIRDYFTQGLLPAENTICGVDGSPWPNLDAEILAAKKDLTPEQQELLDLSRKLSQFKVPRLA